MKFVLSHKTWTCYKNVRELLSENISFHCYGLVQWRLSKGLHLVNVFCQYCNGLLLRSSNIWREYTAVVVNEWAIWSALWNRPGFTAHSFFPLMVIFVLMNLKLWCQIWCWSQRIIFQIFWKTDSCTIFFVFWVRNFKFWLLACLIFLDCAKFPKDWTNLILDIL